MKKHLLFFLAIFFISATHCYSQTNVGGNIISNTIWTKANSPYILTSNVGVPSAYTLTIEPGVIVQRNADYQILINGIIKFNGTATDSIVFSSSAVLGINNTFFIEFQKSNLSASNLSFVTFHNQSSNANNLRIGNESEFSQTSPKNSGSLALSNSNLSYGYTATKGYQAANSLDIDNCLAISATIIGYYPRSEAINISNSNIYNSTINSDSYNMGIKLNTVYLRNCKLLMGCCNANYNISNSKLEDSNISDGGGSPVTGPVTVASTLFLNSTINNPSAQYTISNSQFIITKNILNLAGSQAGSILRLGNITMSNSELVNLTHFNYSGILLSGNNGYNVGGSNSITNNLFTNLYDAFYVTNFSTLTFNSNNIKNVGRYAIANYTLQNFSALNNYFELKAGKTINDLIFDSNDDLKYGLITYTPSSTSINSGAPVSSPTTVLKIPQTDGVFVNWNKNKESNIKNYKIYWGYVNASSYAHSATVASSDTSFTINGAAITDSIAVTALNLSSTGNKDQLNGFESWYSSATQPAPIITSFTPATAATGAQITINGANFGGITALTFGGIPAASFTVVSSTQITATIGTAATGSVSVTTDGGTSILPGFTFIPVPTITSFTPTSSGPGSTITITGTGFTNATAVLFGNTAPTSFTVNSATRITAVIAAGTTGSVSVTTAGGTATLAGFTFFQAPTITSFTPTTAKAGAVVILTGTNFTGTTTVSFGGTPATTFTVVSPTSITATVASGTTGTVSVITPGGSVLLPGFSFIPTPTITSFSPGTAVAGTMITITGTNFTDATMVTFGGVAAVFSVVSATTITATVGMAASGNITVTTPGGVASLSGFTFIPAPAITSFTPTATYTGSLITITGANFTGATAVNIGGTPAASFNVISATTITAKIGTGATGSISVTAPGGTGTLGGFSYNNNLPANNFTITANSVTCKGATNGSISIVAAQNLNYTATITGGGLNTPYTFTTSTAITNLAAGNYNICFTAAGLSNFQQCFTIVITEPKDLAVYTAVNTKNNSVTLNLAGSASYNISLNGVNTTTTSSNVTLLLNKGNNNIAVTTDLPCQGVIEKQINLSDDPLPYPNPFVNRLSVNLGAYNVTNAAINIYNLNYTRVYSKQLTNISGVVQLDVSDLDRGIYVLKLTTDKTEKVFKIIKNEK
jgi:hypothetical protein